MAGNSSNSTEWVPVLVLDENSLPPEKETGKRGENSIVVTKEEVSEHSRLMREHTEKNVALLEKLFAFAEASQRKQQKLQEQLREECNKRQSVEAELSATQDELKKLKEKTNELENKLAEQAKAAEQNMESLKQTLEDKSNKLRELERMLLDEENLSKGLKYLRRNVDAFRVGQGALKEPCGACMLPNGCVIVADTLEGLLLYSCNTELIKQVTSNEWKWPQGLVYNPDQSTIMVSMVKKFGSDKENKFKRVIVVFSTDLEELKTIDGPTDAGYDNVAKGTAIHKLRRHFQPSQRPVRG